MLLFKSLTLSHGIRKCCPSAFMELTPKSAEIYQNSSFLVDNFEEGNIRSKSLCAVIKMSQRGEETVLPILLHVSVLINFVLYREKQAWDKSTFWPLSEIFSSKEEVYKVDSNISFGDSGSTFEAKSFSNICDFGQKLTKHFASMCWFFDDLKYWSKIHPSRGVDRSNESVSDAKNSCSTPAWYKNLSTYCPLSHLMSRSFPWARNPITLVNSRKGRGLPKKK